MKKIKMNNPQSEKSISNAFDEFIKSCKVRNLSDRTLKYYTDYMGQFKHFLVSKNISLTKEIIPTTVEDFTLYLKNSGLYRDVTINTSLRAVRAIIYYFQHMGYCKEFKINLIKVDKESKEPYTQDELKLLLNRPKTNSFSEYRNWVTINFLLATGVRVGELVNIQITDVNLDEAMVKIRKGKSRREPKLMTTH